jgi:hypothetical protein
MLFNVIGNAIYFEKALKKDLDGAFDESEEQQALTRYLCDFFGFFIQPLYPR